jgi:hypothetical protein
MWELLTLPLAERLRAGYQAASEKADLSMAEPFPHHERIARTHPYGLRADMRGDRGQPLTRCGGVGG